MPETADAAPPTPRWVPILFAALVATLCVWALSLPIFPTQDGSMHKYYVYVASQLLDHSPLYQVYDFKHPLPPYATYYAALLGLSHFTSLDMAEKILICCSFLLLAYGFRFAARALGPSSDLVALCVMPLLVNWALVMGFLNYCLGVGLFFYAYGAWLRAAEGRRSWWFGFVALVFLLTLTHPVPLLVLVVLCGLDLAVRAWQHRLRQHFYDRQSGWFRPYRSHLAAFLFLFAALMYPALLANHQKTENSLHLFGLHPHVLVKALALFGVSPFETRSLSLSINLYRFGLYALILGSLAAAAYRLRQRFRQRALRPSDTLLLAAVLLALLIPVIPRILAGGDFFSTRLLLLVWLGALCAASSFPADRPWFRRIVPAFAVLMAAFTLIPGEQYLRPIAKQLVTLEKLPLPSNQRGMVLFDPSPLHDASRYRREIAFNPYIWSMALPFIEHHDVMLNSPWLSEANIPIGGAPGANVLSHGQQPFEGQLNWLPASERKSLLAASDFILYAGSSTELKLGMLGSLAPADAQRFRCQQQGWYEVCYPRGALDLAALR
jgi:hypothetical protein